MQVHIHVSVSYRCNSQVDTTKPHHVYYFMNAIDSSGAKTELEYVQCDIAKLLKTCMQLLQKADEHLLRNCRRSN